MYTTQQAEEIWQNATTLEHKNLTQTHISTDNGYEVPISAAILLSFLAFSLIFLAAMYLVLSHMQTKVMNKLNKKERNYVNLGLRALVSREARRLINDGQQDLDEEEEEELMLQIANEKMLQEQQNSKKTVAKLQVSVVYSDLTGRIAVEILQLTDLATAVIQHGFATTVQIHAKMQPLPKKFRYRTLSKPASKAKFNERFAFDGFRREDLRKCWFRFRLYASSRFGKGKVLGQVNAGVMDFEVDDVWGTLWLNVAPSEEINQLISSAKELNTY